MKKLLLLLFMYGIFSALPILASDVIRQDCLIFTLYNPAGKEPYAIVTDHLIAEATDLVIPDYVSKDNIEYPVTEIGKSAFNSCSHLKSIILGNTMQSIGAFAFKKCN